MTMETSSLSPNVLCEARGISDGTGRLTSDISGPLSMDIDRELLHNPCHEYAKEGDDVARSLSRDKPTSQVFFWRLGFSNRGVRWLVTVCIDDDSQHTDGRFNYSKIYHVLFWGVRCGMRDDGPGMGGRCVCSACGRLLRIEGNCEQCRGSKKRLIPNIGHYDIAD